MKDLLKKKILVLGNGFVGKPLAEYLKADTTTKRLEDIKLRDIEKYDVVINTAAKTTIDWCEAHKVETYNTNVTDALRIAEMCHVAGVKHIFFSSACIFKSEGAWDIQYEDAIPNPQCFYTYTKLIAEQLISELAPETIIIRPRLLISEKSHPRNTIDKLLKYDKILTNQESATVLEDLIVKISELVEDPTARGAYNIFNEGTISPSELATAFLHAHTRINKATLDSMVQGKARRVSTILGTKRGCELPPIRERITEIAKNWKY